MSREAARIEIVTACQAAVASFTGTYTPLVEYENKYTVDYANQQDPYLAVDINYIDGQQMDLGSAPLLGVYGQIVLAVPVMENKGTSAANILMGHFTKELQFRIFGLVKTQVAKPQPSVTRKGWFSLVTVIDFWYHEPV